MNWDYIAGYFDGEGNVSVGANRLSVAIRWYNTHRGSLEDMRVFMGCGHVRSGNKPQQDHHAQGYLLDISDRASLLRVIDELIPRCIIKRDALIRARAAAERLQPLAEGWGNLAALGAEEVERLYNEGMTQEEIGATVGVTNSAVKNFMKRYGIKARPRSVAQSVTHKRYRGVDQAEVLRLYHEEGLSQQQIAQRVGCAQTTISNWLRHRFT